MQWRLVFAATVVLFSSALPLAAQEETNPSVTLTLYEGNPILAAGESGAWDLTGVGLPRVVFDGVMFHMFFSGWRSVVPSVGYATSDDGLTWTKYEDNPVFTLDVSPTRRGVISHYEMLDGDTWVMYFTASEGTGLSVDVMRATAPAPTGPWTIDAEPVFSAGTRPDWDWYLAVAIDSVLHTDDGYVMYYNLLQLAAGGNGPARVGAGFGRATSDDGIHWTKYDDPFTSEDEFASSDPVMLPVLGAWDGSHIGQPIVSLTDGRWGMFYSGANFGYWSIGYAFSDDGITWTHYGDAPILTGEMQGFAPYSVLVIDVTYYLYYTHFDGQTNTNDISVALVTITRE